MSASTAASPALPLRHCYWVVPGLLLAGEHPGGPSRDKTKDRLKKLLEAGIECFVDLTKPTELPRYDTLLPFYVEYTRKAIKDHGLPASRDQMVDILEHVGNSMRAGRPVYVHCRAGIGRTGTVVGCLLVERGFAGDGALDELNRLWQQSKRSRTWAFIPETEAQSSYIREWQPSLNSGGFEPSGTAAAIAGVGPISAAGDQHPGGLTVADVQARAAKQATGSGQARAAMQNIAAGKGRQKGSPISGSAYTGGGLAAAATQARAAVESGRAPAPPGRRAKEPTPDNGRQSSSAPTSGKTKPESLPDSSAPGRGSPPGQTRRVPAPDSLNADRAPTSRRTDGVSSQVGRASAPRNVPAAPSDVTPLSDATDEMSPLEATVELRYNEIASREAGQTSSHPGAELSRRESAALSRQPGAQPLRRESEPVSRHPAAEQARRELESLQQITEQARRDLNSLRSAAELDPNQTGSHSASARTGRSPSPRESVPAEPARSESAAGSSEGSARLPREPVIGDLDSIGGSDSVTAAREPGATEVLDRTPREVRETPDVSPGEAAQPPFGADPLLDQETLMAARALRERFVGVLLGLAVGDAVAAATQYRRPGTFSPVGDMLGGGPFDLPRGAWSDDTAMALCLAESLLECAGFDARDQVQRYTRWQQEGYLSSTGQCVGITASTARSLAIAKWRRVVFPGSHDPEQLDPEPLSRIAAIPLYYFASIETTLQQAAEASRATCQAPAVLDACRLLGGAVHAALSGQPKERILAEAGPAAAPPVQTSNAAATALAAGVWAFASTDNFRDAILRAANVGGNSDVIASVCGQLAGAHYGFSSIPPSWRNSLMHKELIESYADRLLAHALVSLSSSQSGA